MQQDGTLAECTGGTARYYDWWEMYPAGTEMVHQVSADDKLTGSVEFTGKAYKLAVTDHTHPDDSFATTQKCTGAACLNTSAEWVVERPSGGPCGGLCLLPDYGTFRFTGASVRSGMGTGAISRFPHVKITMANSSGEVLASVSKLTDKASSFTDTWHRIQ